MNTSHLKFLLLGMLVGAILVAASFVYVALRNEFISIQLTYAPHEMMF